MSPRILMMNAQSLSNQSSCLAGQMILKDPTDDYPWLAITLGPSERAVDEYRRMNKVDEEVGEQALHKTPKVHLRSKGLTLVDTRLDTSDDKRELLRNLGRQREVYCLNCGKPFDNRQAYGGQKGQCKRK